MTNQLRAVTSSVAVAGVDLPVADEISVLGVVLDLRLTFHKHVLCDCAVTKHSPSHTFDTWWLRNWHGRSPVVWFCLGSTAAMLCSMALQATESRSCSEYRTMQLRSFLRCQDDPKPARCWGCYTGCPFSRGSSTKWLCWCLKSAAPWCSRTSVA